MVGLATIAASFLPNGEWSPVSASMLPRADLGSSGRGLRFWPDYISPPSRCGRSISEPRDNLRCGLWPDPGAGPCRITSVGGPEEVGTVLYFSLTTLTTTGYGDIVAVDPFARRLRASSEARCWV